MARGKSIIVTSDPKGRFLEVIISGTPKPGTCMEYKQSAGVDANGKFTYEPAGTTAASGTRQGMAADGNRIPIAVLTERGRAGQDMETAFVSGERGMLYYPNPGDELNMLYENQTGTGDDVLNGDKMMVDDGTGKLLTSASTPEAEPFIALEAVTDPTADALVWSQYTGC